MFNNVTYLDGQDVLYTVENSPKQTKRQISFVHSSHKVCVITYIQYNKTLYCYQDILCCPIINHLHATALL